MKKIFRNLDKSLFCAILFFGLMTTVGVATAHAQDTVTNPLITTTGPNVLGSGRIQWNSDIQYLHYGYGPIQSTNGGLYNLNSNSFGIETGLRFGIGSRAELTLGLAGAYNTFDTTLFHATSNVTPSVGAKLLLTDGHGWTPMVSFFTNVAFTYQQNAYNPEIWEYLLRPEVGLQFRNRIGSRWAVDYSLGYSWDRYGNSTFRAVDMVKYSIFARWMATDRLMLGVGFGNDNPAHVFAGDFEARYLATDALQLTLRAGASMGSDELSAVNNHVNALLGVSWMLK